MWRCAGIHRSKWEKRYDVHFLLSSLRLLCSFVVFVLLWFFSGMKLS